MPTRLPLKSVVSLWLSLCHAAACLTPHQWPQVKLCVIVGASGFLINTLLLRCLLAWMGRVRLLWLGAHPLARTLGAWRCHQRLQDWAKSTVISILMSGHIVTLSESLHDACCIIVTILSHWKSKGMTKSWVLLLQRE